MEMEGELQSGYLTGTKPIAARRPKGGGEFNQYTLSLQSAPSRTCVCVCVC